MPRPKKPDPEKSCKQCGTRMERKRFNGRMEDRGVFLRRQYCSLDCSSQAQETNTDATFSKHAKAHRKDSCESCGTNERLQQHHLNGNRADNHPSNLMTLCVSCHAKWHWENGKKPWKEQSACTVCGKPSDGLGLCQKHRIRYKKYGDPLLTKIRNGSQYVLVREDSGTTPR